MLSRDCDRSNGARGGLTGNHFNVFYVRTKCEIVIYPPNRKTHRGWSNSFTAARETEVIEARRKWISNKNCHTVGLLSYFTISTFALAFWNTSNHLRSASFLKPSDASIHRVNRSIANALDACRRRRSRKMNVKMHGRCLQCVCWWSVKSFFQVRSPILPPASPSPLLFFSIILMNLFSVIPKKESRDAVFIFHLILRIEGNWIAQQS